MFHLAAFASSLAASTEAQVSAVADPQLTIFSNGYSFQQPMELVAAMAFGTDLQYAFLKSPSIDVITTPFIRPTAQGTTLPTFATPADYRMNPFRLKADEVVSAYGYQDNAGAQTVNVGIVVRPSPVPPPVGDVYTLRGTSTTAATASQWTQLSTTWKNNLPQGRYAIVGLGVEGASCQFARCIIQNQVWRPGGPAGADETVQGPSMFRKGGLGTWGYFTNLNMPNVEVFATAATASWVVYLDIVKVG